MTDGVTIIERKKKTGKLYSKNFNKPVDSQLKGRAG